MKKFNKLLLTLGLFAGVFGLTLQKDMRKASAEPVKTTDSKIRFTFKDHNNWKWSWNQIKYQNAVVTPGNTFEDWQTGNVNIEDYFVLPSYVLSIEIGIWGEQGWIEPVTLSSHGDWSLGEFDWQDPHRVITRVVRIGDYFEQYSVEEGYDGGVDTLRTRLWFYRGHYAADGGYVALNINDRLIKASGHSHAWTGEDHHNYFAYFDVLLSDILNKDIRLHRIKDDNTTIWNTSSAVRYSSGMSSYLFKIDAVSGDTLQFGANPNKFRSGFFAKVLEGYLTCSPSIDNGYGAFDNMKNNFFKEGAGALGFDIDGDPAAESIIDYSGIGTGNYGSSRGNGPSVNAEIKYNALQALYNASNPNQVISINPQDAAVNSTLIISLLGLTTLAGYYFLTRKKKVA